MSNQRNINVLALRDRLREIDPDDGIDFVTVIVGLSDGQKEDDPSAYLRGVVVHSNSEITGDESMWLVGESGRVMYMSETSEGCEVDMIHPDMVRFFASIADIPRGFFRGDGELT